MKILYQGLFTGERALFNSNGLAIHDSTFSDGESYTVTITKNIDKGTVTTNKAEYVAGETVILTITPDSGYALESVTINGTMDETVIGKTEVSFTMPNEDVAIFATFKEGIPVYFDNSESQWIYVLFHYDNGYNEGRQVGNDIYAFIIPENAIGQFTNYMPGMPQEMLPEGPFSTEDITPIAGQTYHYIGYDIIVDGNISGGTIIPKVTNASYGQTVTLTVTPDSGMTVKQVIVKDGNRNEIEVTESINHTYSFTMPEESVTVTAVFEEVTPGVTVYDLWFGGEQFTSERLTVTDENGGTATYDSQTNTLTLNDINITSGYTDDRERVIGIYADGDLTIELVGENNITMPDDNNRSYGIRVKGDLSISGSGSLNAIAGNVIAQDSTEHYSTGIHNGGYLNIYGATVYAKGGDIFSKGESYSCGVSTGGGLQVDFGGSLTAEGGNANGSMAYSTGLEVLGNEEYINISVYDGNMIAKGGDTEGVIVAESNGAYLELAGFYVYENTANVELTSGNAKVTSVDESNKPYACSNGITVYEGDITIHGGTIDISGGTWEGIDGDGWAAYVEGEESEDGAISGGNVLIKWENIELSPSGYGFIGSKVTITSTDEEKGAIFAGTGLKIGDKLIMCQPEGGKVAEIEEEDYAFNTILNSDDSLAKNVVIEPLIHSVKIEGTDYGMSVLVPNNTSINEAYKDMLEDSGRTDFSEIINTEKSGYNFDGFYTKSGEKFNFDNFVNGDMTITAKWKKKSYGGGSSSTTTTTKKNDDGSTTKTTTNKATGTIVETTTHPDGSTTKVETKKDGTVTTTEKDKNGNTTTTALKPDGTSTTTEKNKDGSEKVTEEKADGSRATEETKKDGTKVTTETNADGETTAEIKADGKAEVTIPVPDTEKVQMVVVTDENGNNTYITEIEKNNNGVAVTTDGNATVSVMSGNKKEFVDVHHVDHWSEKSVDFVHILGLMNGTSENHFSPDVHLTRAMLVTVLYRAEGKPTVWGGLPFEDVEEGSYYEFAVVWAKANGIVNGTSATTFEPNVSITREQIAAIMHRYADFKGHDVQVGENTNILSYDDVHHVSEYAIGAMQYAVGSGLIKGKTEATLNPLDNATRAEAAAILERFIKANYRSRC